MRQSGILMPVFSLPSKAAIGTLGKGAYDFVDFLKNAGQQVWQMLPVCPVDYTFSPYQSVSCFAGEPMFIDPFLLEEWGLLFKGTAESLKKAEDYTAVNYPLAKENADFFLKEAFSRFTPDREYDLFLKENEFWIYDFALYSALKEKHSFKSWIYFEKKYKDRENNALREAKEELKERINYHIFVQFIFYKQWFDLKNYANKNGITLMGDMPIYAPLDSADVWANRDCFMLNADGTPKLVAGTPPDAFSATGQLWGSPVYDFCAMKRQEKPYLWWRKRIAHAANMFDTVRIDHFRAFSAFYAIPAGEATAQNGKWTNGPGSEIFDLVRHDLNKLPIVAEDLGLITKDVTELLESVGIPGMRVLQFAFDGKADNFYLPHNYKSNTVAYIGTHDNDTVVSWYASLDKRAKNQVDNYLSLKDEAINWAAIRTLMSSVADTVIFTLQDIMGLSSDARINVPGTVQNNWKWRMLDGCANDWLAGILKEITVLYGR